MSGMEMFPGGGRAPARSQTKGAAPGSRPGMPPIKPDETNQSNPIQIRRRRRPPARPSHARRAGAGRAAGARVAAGLDLAGVDFAAPGAGLGAPRLDEFLEALQVTLDVA